MYHQRGINNRAVHSSSITNHEYVSAQTDNQSINQSINQSAGLFVWQLKSWTETSIRLEQKYTCTITSTESLIVRQCVWKEWFF